MPSKILHWIGLGACVILIISCFLPWTYYPPINETFTGFNVKKFPNGTYYGKAGMTIVIITILILICMLLPKIWAKRTNLFLSAFLMAYIMRTYIIFTGSLFEGEVIKKPGIYLIIFSSLIIMLSAIFPDHREKQEVSSK